VLEGYRSRGFHEITFLIPDSEYAMTAEVEGLLANLSWLEARILNWNMAAAVASAIEAAGI